MNDIRQRLQNHMISWLQQQGIERSDIDSSSKLGRFWRTLTKFKHYHPRIDEPVDFKYGHLFSDRQKYGFFSTMVYEIDRLGSLVNLEALSHSTTSSIPTETLHQLQPLAERRTKGGTRYQNQLAIHYLLQALRANGNNTKKANLASFLTGFSEQTLRQNWSNIHRKSDERDIAWENDMKTVRRYFEELGLSEVVKLIDSDLSSQRE